MKIYREGEIIRINKPIVTVGTFDGVHLGHQHIFRELIESAKKVGGEPVVITLWPHPRMIVHPNTADITLLNTLEEKIELIRLQGVKYFVILPFTKEFSQLSSTEFIEEYLHKRIGIKGLIMGYDHRFGRDRLGNSKQLHECAEKYGFFIKDVDPFCLDGEKVSSTEIRNALFEGNVELANSMLSRNYSLTGIVEIGKKVGRDLGFPTANLQTEGSYKLIPKDGVYAVKVQIKNKEYIGMLNIGLRPTVNKGDENRSIETHVIDFDEDIYGQIITLIFYKRIRDEIKFSSLDNLVTQLKSDKENIVNYFNTSETK